MPPPAPRPSAALLSGAPPPPSGAVRSGPPPRRSLVTAPSYAVIRMYTFESFSGSRVMLWIRAWLRSP